MPEQLVWVMLRSQERPDEINARQIAVSSSPVEMSRLAVSITSPVLWLQEYSTLGVLLWFTRSATGAT